MQIGLLGGAFDPIHYGHIRPALQILRYFRLNRILFVPNRRPPFPEKTLSAGIHDRETMVRLAIKAYSGFSISTIESRSRRGRSYTIDSLRQLSRFFPNADFYFICGVDTFLNLPRWKEVKEVLSRTNFIVVERPDGRAKQIAQVLAALGARASGPKQYKLKWGHKIFFFTPVKLLPYSSTEIRKRVFSNRSIRGMLPESIRRYIIHRNLYKENE